MDDGIDSQPSEIDRAVETGPCRFSRRMHFLALMGTPADHEGEGGHEEEAGRSEVLSANLVLARVGKPRP